MSKFFDAIALIDTIRLKGQCRTPVMSMHLFCDEAAVSRFGRGIIKSKILPTQGSLAQAMTGIQTNWPPMNWHTPNVRTDQSHPYLDRYRHRQPLLLRYKNAIHYHPMPGKRTQIRIPARFTWYTKINRMLGVRFHHVGVSENITGGWNVVLGSCLRIRNQTVALLSHSLQSSGFQ